MCLGHQEYRKGLTRKSGLEHDKRPALVITSVAFVYQEEDRVIISHS